MNAYKKWVAFLSADIINPYLEQKKENCEGCRIGLHQHNHFNLLEALKDEMSEISLLELEALKVKMNEISMQMDMQKLLHSLLIRFEFLDRIICYPRTPTKCSEK